MLDRLGHATVTTSDPEAIAGADGLVLPGVGAFDRCMSNFAERGLVEPLTKLVCEREVPVLGICVGMQLFARGSEEGESPGLGWVQADVVRFDVPGLLVPHMGWNDVKATPNGTALFSGEEERFYFVHSFHLRCDDEGDVAAWAHHGVDFPAAITRGNIMGVQFHPEKSHRFGLALLDRFANVASRCAD
ncbi:MAG: imidazole glycerol phosphate synthase subunit HisH [Actinomycetota bacterium]|nr:imidazole glycerol phosphate synthase subunit HisH [Actinomycetota bacterium]